MAKEKVEVLIGGISFSLKEAKKLKKERLKAMENFLNVPVAVAEVQLARFLEKK